MCHQSYEAKLLKERSGMSVASLQYKFTQEIITKMLPDTVLSCPETIQLTL